MSHRRGDWIQTFTGGKFYPFDPLSVEVDIRDIAHSLSMLCRFVGHCREFYSVAQHSVIVAEVVGPEHKLWALLHDAAEAYIGDISRPLKNCLRVEGVTVLREADRAIMRAVASRFGLPADEPPQVKSADEGVLMAERRDLMADTVIWDGWSGNRDVVEYPNKIEPVGPAEAKELFMEAFWRYT